MKKLKWICGGVGILACAFVYRLSSGDINKALYFLFLPVGLLVAIERVINATKERKASGLTEQQFMLKKAGSPNALRQQALVIRVFSCIFILFAVPTLVFGVIAAIGGSFNGFFIALAGGFMLYVSKLLLSTVSKMVSAAEQA